MTRQRVAGNSPWEAVVGYSRALRVGQFVAVSGTTATLDDGSLAGAGDPYAQTVQALKNIERALAAAGASLADVIRTRIFVIDIDHAGEIGRAHKEVFGGIRPATSMLEVRRLIDPQMLVEIEVDAILEEG